MNKKSIEERLTGRHPNSLGETVAVTEDVLRDKTEKLMDELCSTYSSEDDVVRMRVSSVLKRICGLHAESVDSKLQSKPEWILSRFDWLIDDIGWKLDQPSAKWSVAQIMQELDSKLAKEQRKKVVELLKHNLETEDDWIVQNVTAEALVNVALVHNDKQLKEWLLPRLKRMAKDSRKSVAGKGRKFYGLINV